MTAIIEPNIHHLNIILIMGIVIFGGIAGAKIFQKLRIPQVIGYLAIGLLIGETGMKIISTETIGTLKPLNYLALGIIGFMIGGELKFELFKKYGKQFTLILLAEGLAAFVLVGGLVTAALLLFNFDLKIAIALGLVLGAIASATDPASTIQVLWEYKTRGILTTAVTAVVALDDALALTLYGLGTSIAGILTGNGDTGIAMSLLHAGYEMGGAIVLGVVGGLILFQILKRTDDNDAVLTFALGAVLLINGLAVALDLDIILASMALGMTLVNVAPKRSTKAFEQVKKFSPPIYILFFVLVGASINISNLTTVTCWLVGIYVIGRSAGKVVGSYFGAKWSGSCPAVRKNLGLCLFAQGGVAVGLSILASQKFDAEISKTVVMVVATTTLIVQIIGPLFVKVGVKNAGEIGLNITEEDLLKSYSVADVMNSQCITINQSQHLKEILNTFGSNESMYYPVIDNDNHLSGIITISRIKEMFAHHETTPWLLACDIMGTRVETTTPKTPLSEAMHKMKNLGDDFICVIQNDKLIGTLDFKHVNRHITAEVLKRREEADNAA
ncbi:MAG: cation:proton antiporter [Phycisphaerae bacterium]|nr:cation:proton antiporter [Phycisphaerae bacterium]